MHIQVLGTGCARCRQLARNTEEALRALGVEAEVEKVERLQDILRAGVLLTPALLVDGKVVVSGKVPDPAGIARLIGSPGGAP